MQAAARYALRLARVSSSGRSISTQAAADLLNKGKQQQRRRILLCFNEWVSSFDDSERKVVRSLTIPRDDDVDDQPQELTLVASKEAPYSRQMNLWLQFGDKILNYDYEEEFSVDGPCIFWLDTAQLHPELEFQYKIQSFPVSKSNLTWGQIDGKLYCIDDDLERQYSQFFQVLDPEAEQGWQSLDYPPYLLGHRRGDFIPHRALFLDGSKKIIGWDRDLRGTFCFDVTKHKPHPDSYNLFPTFLDPEFGWKRLSYHLTPHGGRPFVIHHPNHPVFGAFNLFFDYNPFGKNSLQISPFYLSNDCQSFKAIKNSNFQLPQLCCKYLPEFPFRIDNSNCSELELMYGHHSFSVFEFVNLGDEKFGFILHKHPFHDPSYCPPNMEHKGEPGGVLFLTYKYEIISVNNAMEIHSRLIGHRHFRYRSQLESSAGILMLGAFSI